MRYLLLFLLFPLLASAENSLNDRYTLARMLRDIDEHGPPEKGHGQITEAYAQFHPPASCEVANAIFREVLLADRKISEVSAELTNWAEKILLEPPPLQNEALVDSINKSHRETLDKFREKAQLMENNGGDEPNAVDKLIEKYRLGDFHEEPEVPGQGEFGRLECQAPTAGAVTLLVKEHSYFHQNFKAARSSLEIHSENIDDRGADYLRYLQGGERP